jgi:superoxide dismutase, Fe-Mn family
MPYGSHALEPVLSDATVRFHRRKQERYARKTADLVQGTMFADLTLGQLVHQAQRRRLVDPHPTGWIRSVCEQANQAWSHALMWLSMAPTTRQRVRPWWVPLLRDEWESAAREVFGSGWVWLVLSADGQPRVEATSDAQMPTRGSPLAVMDVWEHAYYLDYPDAKDDYVRAWWERLADWELAARLMAGEPLPGALQ